MLCDVYTVTLITYHGKDNFNNSVLDAMSDEFCHKVHFRTTEIISATSSIISNQSVIERTFNMDTIGIFPRLGISQNVNVIDHWACLFFGKRC